MKKIAALFLAVCGVFASGAVRASDETKSQEAFAQKSDAPDENVPDPSKHPLFEVSSDELSASDSLDRISGKIDLGLASPDQTYKSKNQYAVTGPFSHQDSAQDSDSSY